MCYFHNFKSCFDSAFIKGFNIHQGKCVNEGNVSNLGLLDSWGNNRLGISSLLVCSGRKSSFEKIELYLFL